MWDTGVPRIHPEYVSIDSVESVDADQVADKLKALVRKKQKQSLIDLIKWLLLIAALFFLPVYIYVVYLAVRIAWVMLTGHGQV